MTLRYFQGCKTIEEVKKRYKKLALKYHPDRQGGDEEVMKRINHEYEMITKDPYFKFADANEEAKQDYREYPEIINRIITFRLTIEICGNWIWLSGNTRPYKDQLREIGFKFAGQKKMWYWRPNDYKSHNQKPMTMDYIRSRYGSDVVEVKQKVELEE